MSDLLHGSGSPPKQDPEALVLRGRPRPAVRFRRGLIVGATGAAAAALVGLSWFALQPPALRNVASAAGGDEPMRNGGADALAGVPKSYADVPRLGPPLPGDLGRPILEHQRGLAAAHRAPGPDSASEEAGQERSAAEERQRMQAARQAAWASPVIVQLARRTVEPLIPAPQPVGRPAPQASPMPVSANASRDQQEKIDFARSESDKDVNAGALTAPPLSTLTVGTVIDASLITGLDSDLPGMVIAQVTRDVRDSATGRIILIPQGARLVGRYDSAVAYGQRRALLEWTRIVFPDGSSVALDNMPAVDASGYAGIEDQVDSHSWRLLKGVALSTLLGVGAQLSFGGEGGLVRAIRESTQQGAADGGNRITSRNLDVQPTIRVRPGWPVRAIVDKDLVLRPWRG